MYKAWPLLLISKIPSDYKCFVWKTQREPYFKNAPGRRLSQPGASQRETRGGPHPSDRCSSQLRWNPAAQSFMIQAVHSAGKVDLAPFMSVASFETRAGNGYWLPWGITVASSVQWARNSDHPSAYSVGVDSTQRCTRAWPLLLISVPNLHRRDYKCFVWKTQREPYFKNAPGRSLSQPGASQRETRGGPHPSDRCSSQLSSIVHAIACHYVFERDGVRFSESEVDQPLFGQVHVLKIV